ncbi:MAG: hypothetical protein ACI4D7_01455 [Lachnospiraceae bacterium]
MDKSYQKFLRLGISLASVGIETRNDETLYFCTPKGASLIGWAGADGIHYCFIRGFREMVFAISPMNTAPDYVHPLAENFTDFLRLLLACGDAAVLEQAWMWDKVQFETFLKENPATEKQKKTLYDIAEKMKLTAMEQPWEYIKSLQSSFDYSKINYTEDYYDMDMNSAVEPTAPKWKVYFDGNFWGHQGKDHAGKEIAIGKQFEWAGHHWLIPAAYSCSKGLVLDFCMRVEADEIRAFMKKWNLTQENDSYENFSREQQMELDLDNPLCFHFNPWLELNGRELRTSHGCAITYNPCLPDGMVIELEAKWAAEHYGLDTSYGWVIYRDAFPWEYKRRPEIKTLSLTMEQQPVSIPGPHFTVKVPGDSFRFVHPVRRTEYMLTIQELEQQTLPKNSFGSDRYFYPMHFTAMSYTLSPEASERITVSDSDDSDKPLETMTSDDSFAPSASSDAACIGIIGGADGPTAIVFGDSSQGKVSTACSALHFEPVQHDIDWRITFHEKNYIDFTLTLI